MSDRREFLKDAIRGVLLGGLALGGIHLSSRKSSAKQDDDACTHDGVCRKCPLLQKCGHPNARSFKEVTK